MSASIHVKILVNINKSCQLIDISEALVVADLKAITSKKIGIDIDKFDILLCGRLLSGETSVQVI